MPDTDQNLEPVSAIPEGGDSPQNLATVSTGGDLPTVNPETSQALDDLLKDVTKEPDAPAPTPVVTPPVAAPDPAAPPAPVVPESFESIEPPPHTKPKTAESFAKVKLLAKQEIEATKAKLKEAEEKLQKATATKPLTDEVEKELTELRGFRSSMEVEADPEFKKFDTEAKANEDAIISRLTAAGVAAEAIAKVKEIGVGEVDWDSLADKLPGNVRRFIESKLVENENLKDKKTAAIEKAKANAAEFLKGREQQSTKQTEAFQAAARAQLDKFVPQLGWLKVKPIPADAKPEEKTVLDEHNKFVTGIQADMDEVLKDNSPETKSVLVLAYAQLKRVRADFEGYQTTSKAQIDSLTKERDEAKALLERVKGASTTRLRDSNAPDKTVKLNASAKIEDGHTALDRLRDEALAAQDQ